MNSYSLSEHTGMIRSSLRPLSSTSPSFPRVSSKATASTAPLISSSGPRTPLALSRSSALLFSRPTMPVMVQPPLSENQNFLPMVQAFLFVHVWGFPGVSGLSRPHALIALSKNPLGFRRRGFRGFARGSGVPSRIGPYFDRPDS